MKSIKGITVVTRAYELSHGHAPRGQGYWMFELRFANNEHPPLRFEVKGPCAYSVARAAACARAATLGACFVSVKS